MTKVKNDPTQDVFLDIHPMCAKKVEDFSKLTNEIILTSNDWWLEEKYDGERQILQWRPDGLFRATSRKVSVKTQHLSENSDRLPQFQGLFTPLKGPTVLDVELLPPEGEGQGSNLVGSVLRSKPSLALKKQQERGVLQAVVFDILFLNGKDLRHMAAADRRTILENFHDRMVAKNRWPEFMQLSPRARTTQEKKDLLATIYARGGEGAMGKHVDGVYTDTMHEGRRSPHVLKIKPFEEDDVIILGFEQGEGKYNTHLYGAIRLGQWIAVRDYKKMMAALEDAGDKSTAAKLRRSLDNSIPTKALTDGFLYYMLTVGTCSGFTQEQQQDFTDNPDKYIGKAMMVKYQQRITKTARMRHPNFLKMRPDKNPALCIYTPPQ